MPGLGVVLLLSWAGAASARLEVPAFPFPAAPGWSVFLDDSGRATLVPGTPPSVPEGAVAWGTYTDAINETGWAVLDLHTSEDFGGEEQSYAAGFLEGALTSERMAQHQRNMWGVDFHNRPVGKMPPVAANFSDRNLRWMQSQVKKESERDPYWRMVGFLLEQLRGLSDGYNQARKFASQPAVPLAEVLMQSVVDTDMDDLMTAIVENGKFVNSHYRDYHSRKKHRRHRGHCSALVQLAPDGSDLWTGHVTWDEYRGMLRTVKYLDMPLPGAVSRRVSFTSNPGSLYSGDDWYVTDQGLTVLETSIENYNASLWQRVQPESVLTWVRAMVANRLATTGAQWADLQLRHQSGTCNNQWMVVDYKRFTPGKALADGTLWVAETMPGHTHAEDMTRVLAGQGSWPSYNIPYFEDIWTAGGYGAMQAQAAPADKDQYSFGHDVRARMFTRARDDGKVTDMQSFARLLRYNDRSDPLAKADPCHGISARCDLNPVSDPSYDCFGGIDAKVMGARRSSEDLSFFAVSSPAYNEQERPFAWHDQDGSVDGCKPSQHIGHPDTFDFSWYELPSSVGPLLASGGGSKLTEVPVRKSLGPFNLLFLMLAVGAAATALGSLFAGFASKPSRLATLMAAPVAQRDEYVRIEA